MAVNWANPQVTLHKAKSLFIIKDIHTDFGGNLFLFHNFIFIEQVDIPYHQCYTPLVCKIRR